MNLNGHITDKRQPTNNLPPQIRDLRHGSRPERIQTAVSVGLRFWRGEELNGAEMPAFQADEFIANPILNEIDDVDLTAEGEMRALPRRKPITGKATDTTPPQMRFVSYEIQWGLVFRRLFIWLWALGRYFAGTFWDIIRRKDSTIRRAKRLRTIFERVGGSFLKIGQYLALRIDFLPWEASEELGKMVDKMPAFPIEQAISRIEKAIGCPMEQKFLRFDPDPVASGTGACVYQALLLNGKRVVVKVQRPGAGELLTADLKLFDWLLDVIEFLTILRPGATHNMRRELRDTMMEELQFVQEARHQDSFRRAAKKSGKKWFTAPKVYFDLSDELVIVEEFGSGIWLWELIAAIEQNNEEVLNLVKELNIDRKKVGQRLTWVNYWGWDQYFFFHGDPDPHNIIIGKDSKLIFIDFGSVGAINYSKQQALQQNMQYAWKRDPLGMARASIVLLEPLPAIDVIEFTKELESINRQLLYVFEAEPSSTHWWERTSSAQWVGLINTARAYNVSIDFRVLRLLRAIMLFDTISARVYPELDIIAEYREFTNYRARQARRTLSRQGGKQLQEGVNDMSYLWLERVTDIGEGLFFQLRHSLRMPAFNYNLLSSKWAFTALMSVVFIVQLFALSLLFAGFNWLLQIFQTREFNLNLTLLTKLVDNRLFWLAVLLLVFINGRKILFRMHDKEME